MNLSLNKIKEYGFDLDSKTLDDMLTKLGHEVETIDSLNIPNLVIGHVEEITKHPDADKLNIAKVNTGKEVFQIVCGAPNIQENTKVIVALIGAEIQGHAIKEVKLKGVTSSGMICSLAELGLPKAVLNKKDIDGICILEDDAPVGEDASVYLGINDEILDISLTADRGDCQNYQGIAKDLNALTKYANPKFELINNIDISDVESNSDNSYSVDCSVPETKYFSHTLIRNIKVSKSSTVNEIYLMKNNIKPQNNIVDILNNSLIEFGLPTHAYDADKIVGGLKVQKTTKDCKFIALDEKEYDVVKGTLVICDDEKIVSIAGVIGSNDTKITDSTQNILLEVAIFDPYQVRIGAKNIFKKTDASIRYEKGVDQSQITPTRNFILNNIFLLNANLSVSNVKEINNLVTDKQELTIDYNDIQKVLGVDIEIDSIKQILTDLQFEVNDNILKVPFARHDINYQNDIAEEVIRVYGLENVGIDESMKTINLANKLNSKNELSVRKVEDLLLSLGLNQTITYSLVSKEQSSLFTNNKLEAVELAHPISNERSTYRKSVVTGLVDTALYNFNRQQTDSKLFEIGNVYYYQNGEVKEETKMSGLLSGQKEHYYLGSKKVYDFFDLKAIVQNFFDYFHIDITFEKMTDQVSELNPYAAADIIHNGQVIGYIGQVHIDLTGKNKYPIYVFEIDINVIMNYVDTIVRFSKINEYPIIKRDLTLIGDTDLSVDVFYKSFENIELLENVKLIDIFYKDDQKSLTFTLTFTDKEKTMKSEEVDKQILKILENAKANKITL